MLYCVYNKRIPLKELEERSNESRFVRFPISVGRVPFYSIIKIHSCCDNYKHI